MASDYTPGMVAQLLGGGQSQKKGKLASLFSVPQLVSPLSTTEKVSKKKKKKPAEQNGGVASAKQPKHSAGFNPPPGIVHESMAPKNLNANRKRKKTVNEGEGGDENNAKDTKRPRRDRQKKTTEKRTVFVGNVPVTANKKALLKLFKPFGEIESVRFRCAPVADPTTKKRVAMIKKEFHEKRNSMVSYICFKEEESAKKAISLNGHMVDGLHIRVDSAQAKTTHETKKTVFVGNLPFSAEEENIRSHFEDCGKIDYVRVVRDRQTNLGKGFCYIQFETTASAKMALQKDKSTLNNRELRVQRCLDQSKKDQEKDAKKKKKKKKTLKDSDSNSALKEDAAETPRKTHKKTNKMWQPTNATSLQFEQAQKLALKKKFRQAKKKKKRADDNKKKDAEITKVLGPAARPQLASKENSVKQKKKDKKGLKDTFTGERKNKKSGNWLGKGKEVRGQKRGKWNDKGKGGKGGRGGRWTGKGKSAGQR